MNLSRLAPSDERKSIGTERKQDRVRILLADDNAEILTHASELLQSNYDIVGTVADGSQVCSETRKLRPELVVLDISMGEWSGIDVAKRLKQQGFAGKIMFMSVHEDPDFVSAALGSGGRAYVIKQRMAEDLRPAIKAVLSDQMFISAP